MFTFFLFRSTWSDQTWSGFINSCNHQTKSNYLMHTEKNHLIPLLCIEIDIKTFQWHTMELIFPRHPKHNRQYMHPPMSFFFALRTIVQLVWFNCPNYTLWHFSMRFCTVETLLGCTECNKKNEKNISPDEYALIEVITL